MSDMKVVASWFARSQGKPQTPRRPLALDAAQVPKRGFFGRVLGGPPSQFRRELERHLRQDIDEIFKVSSREDQDRIIRVVLARLGMFQLSEVGTTRDLTQLKQMLRDRSQLASIKATLAAREVDRLLDKEGFFYTPPVSHDDAVAAIERGLALAFPDADEAVQKKHLDKIIAVATGRQPRSDPAARIDNRAKLAKAKQALRELVKRAAKGRGGARRPAASEAAAIMEAFPTLRRYPELTIERVRAHLSGKENVGVEQRHQALGQLLRSRAFKESIVAEVEKEVAKEPGMPATFREESIDVTAGTDPDRPIAAPDRERPSL